MGFAIYNPSQRWGPEDFYTGGDKPFASLANIPRQIFEGVQMREARDLKEREMANKERQTNLEAERNTMAESQHKETMKYRVDRDKIEDERHKESMELQNRNMARLEALANSQIQRVNAQMKLAKTAEEKQSMINRYDYERKRFSADAGRYLMDKSHPIFSDPKVEGSFRAALGMAGSSEDALRIFEMKVAENNANPNLVDKKALAALQPILSAKRDAEIGYWKFANGTLPPVMQDDLFLVGEKQRDFEVRTKGVDKNTPLVRSVLEVLNATPENESAIIAALGSHMNKLDAKSPWFNQSDYSRTKQALTVVQKMLKEEEEKKKKRDRGMLPGYLGMSYKYEPPPPEPIRFYDEPTMVPDKK
jgi:hypothetical protein